VTLAAAIAIACGSNQSETDKRIAELEKQLAETKNQAATTQQPVETPPPAPAAAAPQSAGAPPAAARSEARPASQQPAKPEPRPQAKPEPAARAKPEPPASQQFAEQAKKAEEAQRLLDEQKAINAKQAETNEQLKREVEKMKPRTYTLPVGTIIPVRLTRELSTSQVSNGSTFDLLLEKDLMSGDTVVAESGARVTGVVVSSDPGGRVKGTASLTVGVRSILGVGGAPIAVSTTSYTADAESTKKKDAVRTGVATGVGAIIGGIAGGGSGAAIGAGVGAGAGVGTNMATRGKAAVIPAETLLQLELTAPAKIVIQP
jgi:hypothetical protein